MAQTDRAVFAIGQEPSMGQPKRTTQEFAEEFRRQVRLLTKAAREYDGGDQDEALNIAVRLRVLFHQTNHSTSMLTHLGAQQIKMLSTATKPSPTAGFWAGITDMKIGWEPRIAEFFPRLRKGHWSRPVPFDHWWTGEPTYQIRDVSKGTADPVLSLKRRDVVLLFANQAGGAHVVDEQGAKLMEMLEGLRWSITYNPDDGPSVTVPFKNAGEAALRQIAYEVLNSQEFMRLQSVA